jgi:hypothetical protein
MRCCTEDIRVDSRIFAGMIHSLLRGEPFFGAYAEQFRLTPAEPKQILK